MEPLLEKFCRYVRVDTRADDTSTSYPSSPGQLVLGRMLAAELRELGASEVVHTEHGLVYATIPATIPDITPVIALVAHLDTSPECSGHGVSPQIHRNYDGRDIVLPADPSKVIRVSDSPELKNLVGRTIVTTDGTTLLGSDDKSGVAVIMETAARLLSSPDIKHGKIRVLFTCDEEIGHGVDHVDLKTLGADVAYTLDGGGTGEIDNETFSADLATIKITGRNIHPAMAKGRMINSVRAASAFVAMLPTSELSPESTEGRDGFLHPYRIDAGVGEASIKILLRDFDTQKLVAKADLLRSMAERTKSQFPDIEIEVDVKAQYRNMAEGLRNEPRAVEYAEEAMKRAGLQPKRTIVRGGTDGSRLTEIGLPTPNLSTGEHNLHSILEWTCLEEMEVAVVSLIHLAEIWGSSPSR